MDRRGPVAPTKAGLGSLCRRGQPSSCRTHSDESLPLDLSLVLSVPSCNPLPPAHALGISVETITRPAPCEAVGESHLLPNYFLPSGPKCPAESEGGPSSP